MYEAHVYDKPGDFGPDPVVVLVVSGTHDVSRLVNLFNRGSVTIEQIEIGHKLTARIRRHNGGQAALKLLKQHGGPDLLENVGGES